MYQQDIYLTLSLIDISIVKMGSYLNQPIRQVISVKQGFQGGKIQLYVAAVQGWRKKMEDYYISVKIDNQVTLFGVFDGHGGPQVACYVSRIFHRQLKNEPNLKLKNYHKALSGTFKRVDEILISDRGQEAIRKIQKQLNVPVVSQNQKVCMQVGCTANIILITKNVIYCANVGDTRSMLMRADDIIGLSQDHKPNNPYQKNRILKSGGKVTNNRINGGLNISRAFGDYSLKVNSKKPYNQQMLTSCPQIIQCKRSKSDQYIVVASDGIWENFNTKNQLLAKKIRQLLEKNQNDQKKTMSELLDSLIASHPEALIGCDNMTMIMARFQNKQS